MKFKKIIAAALSASLFLGMTNLVEIQPNNRIPLFSASAEDYVTKGTWGNVEYTLDANGTMIMSGKGKMGGSDWAFWAYLDSGNNYYHNDVKKVIIKGELTSIKRQTFADFHNLESVIISAPVTEIEAEAFAWCYNLSSVILPSTLTTIGYQAFCYSKMESITIPDSVTSFGGLAFEGTPWLKAKQKEDPLVVINGILIDGRASSGNVVITDSVTSIGANAFDSCASLESITIPNSVTSIGGGAFQTCKSLEAVTIPDSVTSIESWAFYQCTRLESITILNPECSIEPYGCTICNSYGEALRKYVYNGIIRGYKGSTAEEYAEKNGYTFVAIDDDYINPNKELTDSDSDGLPDDWEINGIDRDNDGVIDVDLPAMGADPNVKDIFVEADWMVGKNTGLFGDKNKRNTRPSARALEMVYLAFKLHDINLHVDAGPDSIMNYDTGETWGELSGGNAFTYNDSFDRENDWGKTIEENFTGSRVTSFRHCLFVTSYDDRLSTGRANAIPGQFFIISSGLIGNNDIALASTFMHELGHTLGLGHGGVYTGENGESIPDNMNYKPNHLSIMNYTYQLTGLKNIYGAYEIDYQNFELPEIDENHVNENNGIDPKGATANKHLIAKLYVGNKYTWHCSTKEFSAIAKQPIDFNGDGAIQDNIRWNFNPRDLSGYSIINKTENEWKHLQFKTGVIGKTSSAAGVDYNDIVSIDDDNDELTIDEAYELGLLGDKDECQFKNTESKTLYSNLSDQKLRVRIVSLFPDETTVVLKVKSDVLDSDYSKEVTISEMEKIVEIPVKEAQTLGAHDITYTLELANGETITENGTVTVKAPDTVTLNVGDSEEIPSEFVTSCISSDDSVLEIKNNSVIAKSVGTAYLTVLSADDDLYYKQVTVVDSTSVYKLGDTNEDGKIDAKDASFVLGVYAILSTGGKSNLTAEQEAAADVNGDKKIDSKDASAILSYYSYTSTGGKDDILTFLKST